MQSPEPAKTPEPATLTPPPGPVSRRALDHRSQAAALEGLRELFLRFRQSHRAGSKIPQRLRDAVLVALGRGVSASQIARIFGVSASQLNTWRHSGMELAPETAPEPAKARVFSVVEEPALRTAAKAENSGPSAEVELRFPGFSIHIRPATP